MARRKSSCVHPQTLIPFVTFLLGFLVGHFSHPLSKEVSSLPLPTAAPAVAPQVAPQVPQVPQVAIRPTIGNGLIYLSGGSVLQQNGVNNVPMLFYDKLPERLKQLPIVDIGVHAGLDFTIPSALKGWRVYAYEPTSQKYENLVKQCKSRNIVVTDNLEEPLVRTTWRLEQKGVLLCRTKGFIAS